MGLTVLPSPPPAPSAPPAPRFLYVEINKRCNLACKHCHFWTLNDDDRPNYMPPLLVLDMINEFATLSNSQGTVVSCGGEPMLDLEWYFTVSRSAQLYGLKFFSVVNGTQITTSEMAERMMIEGPDEVTVSVNSHRPEIHDQTRGVQGCFALAKGALELLLAARKRLGAKKKIYAMTILCEQNYRDLPAMFDYFLNEVGVDKLKLNVLQPTFGLPSNDKFFNSNLVQDHETLGKILQECDVRFSLGLNKKWLEQVLMYHESVNRKARERNPNGPDGLKLGWKLFTEDQICNTYERNLMVDAYGLVRLCFSHVFPGGKITKPGDLTAFWLAESTEKIRCDMRPCKRVCGISHSVRREAATIEGARKWPPGQA